MAARTNLKTQLNSISSRVIKAEKKAEYQVKQALKSTEQFRKGQLKNIQKIVKQARRLKKKDLLKKAECVRAELETKASQGLGFLLKTLNVPTKKEIERLNKKVTSLQKRLDKLEKPRASK